MHTTKTPVAAAPASSRPASINAVVVVGAILAFLLLTRTIDSVEREAQAGPQPSGGIANPADDRVRMVNELEQINRSLDLIRQRLDKGGIAVEVTKMPPASKPAN